MGATLHGLARQLSIARTAQDKNQGAWRGLQYLLKRRDSLAVRQSQIKQDHIDGSLAQSNNCCPELGHPFDLKRAYCRAGEGFLNQFRIAGIILDQKNAGRRIADGRAGLEAGCLSGRQSAFR